MLEPMNANRNKCQVAMVAPRLRVMCRSTGLFYTQFSFHSPQIVPGIQVPAPQSTDWSRTRYSMLAWSFLRHLNRSWSKHFDHPYLAATPKSPLNKMIQNFHKFQARILRDLYTKSISGGLRLRLPINISSFSWLTYSLSLEKSETWYCCHSTVGLRLTGAWTHPANFSQSH